MTDGEELRGGAAVNPDDAYSAVIDHAAVDAVRALLVHPHVSPQGAHELRRVTTSLADTHGPHAVRDLAETLAADLAELLAAFAEVNHRDPLTVLDEWTHDVPLPFTAADQQPEPGDDPRPPS
jgi:hypothetical protein